MSLNLDSLRFSRRRLLLLSACLLWMTALAWWHRNVVMDDPWITFRYARNLLAGEGLVFNPGERLEGYSNLTWVWLSAVGIFFRVEPLSFARLLGWISSAAVFALLIYGWRTAPSSKTAPPREALQPPPTQPDPPDPTRAPWAAVFLAACYPFAIWTWGGLETTLYALLLLAVLLATAQLFRAPSAALAAATGGLLVLLDLTRPEGFIWGAVVAGAALLHGKKPGARFLWAPVAALAAFHAIYSLWRWLYFGALLPNTVTAKTGGNPITDVLAGVAYLWDYFGGAPALLPGLAALPVIFLLRDCARERRLPEARSQEGLTAILAAAVMLQATLILGVGGDWMPAARFLVPLLPPLCVLAALAVAGWPLFIKAVLAGFLLLACPIEARRDPMLRWTRWAAKDAGGQLLVEPLRQTGQYLRTVAPPDATFAGTEAGVAPYVSGLRFLDMLGLVDPHIAALPGGLHQKYDAEYVLDQQPEFIVLGVTTTPTGEAGTWAPDQQILAHPRFAQEYQEIHRIPRTMPPADYTTLLPGGMVVFRQKANSSNREPGPQQP